MVIVISLLLLGAMRVGHVQLCAPRPLLPLLENVPSLNEVFPHLPQTPTADFHLPLMSLPGVFGDSLETFPNETPYLKAPPQRRHKRVVAETISAIHIARAWRYLNDVHFNGSPKFKASGTSQKSSMHLNM